MGIVFGKQKDNVQVLSIKATQSLPAIRTQRKFVQSSDEQKTRSTSYQTTLPGLPNFISSDEEVEGTKVPVPPPFLLPPLSQRENTFMQRPHIDIPPQVIATLSSSSAEEYSSCVENFESHIEREKTLVMKHILGDDALDGLELDRKNPQALSSRGSLKILSSRESYRKTCLRSRKRARRNSCVSEESSLSHVWSREEDTLSPGEETAVSDVRTLIRDTPVRRHPACRVSRKSTLESGLRFNSSSDEGLPEFSIRFHLAKHDQRLSRRKPKRKEQVARHVTEHVTPLARAVRRRKSGSRVSSAWFATNNRGKSSKQRLCSSLCEDSYDASSEMSSSGSEDELNYSNRFKTNPFLNLRSSANFVRHRYLMEEQPTQDRTLISGSSPISVQDTQSQWSSQSQPSIPEPSHRPDLIRILPEYAKSSYNNPPTTATNDLNRGPLPALSGVLPLPKAAPICPQLPPLTNKLKSLQPIQKSHAGNDNHSSENYTGNSQQIIGQLAPRKQNDEFDDLDSAVEMFKQLL